MPRGYEKPLYILPFDHRGTFETKMFGWEGDLDAGQTAEIAAAKRECRRTRPASWSTSSSAPRS
jgi:hypothetical protein